jgi:signal peptidase II
VNLPEAASLRWLFWIGLSAILILLDQWTKNLASSQLQYGRPVELLPVLNLTLQHNSGAAFSFLSNAGGWQRWFFSGVAFLVSAVLCIWLARLQRHDWLLALGLACILGGAVGNLWDRLALGYVVDFLSVHYRNAYFPAFNVADAAITVGAALLILDSFLAVRRGGGND